MRNGWLALPMAVLAALLAVSLRSAGRSKSPEPTTSFAHDTVMAAAVSTIHARVVAPHDGSANTAVNTVQDSAALALLGILLLSLAGRCAGTPETDLWSRENSRRASEVLTRPAARDDTRDAVRRPIRHAHHRHRKSRAARQWRPPVEWGASSRAGGKLVPAALLRRPCCRRMSVTVQCTIR